MSRSRSVDSLKVEDLRFYGQPLAQIVDSTPMSIKSRIGVNIVRSLVRKSGFWGFLPFMSRVTREKKRLISEYPKAYAEASRLGRQPANQFVTMTALFNVVADREGREEAYRFTRNIFQGYAKYTMPALYDVKHLVKCEGDVYANYRAYNIAMFRASDDYHVGEIKEDRDCLTITVDRCVSVDIANAFDCPEVGRLGCDHDLAGYPPIEETVQSEFRRLHTLAKGDKYCDFMFFRKGKCPIDASLNK